MTTENLNLELKISLDEVFENPAEIDEKEFKDMVIDAVMKMMDEEGVIDSKSGFVQLYNNVKILKNALDTSDQYIKQGFFSEGFQKNTTSLFKNTRVNTRGRFSCVDKRSESSNKASPRGEAVTVR